MEVRNPDFKEFRVLLNRKFLEVSNKNDKILKVEQYIRVTDNRNPKNEHFQLTA